MKPIAPPIAPIMPTSLQAWISDTDTDVEISDSEVISADFSNAKSLEIESCELKDVQLNSKLDKFAITDAQLKKLEAAGLVTYKANLLRVVLSDSRFTGADFAEGYFEDCNFKNMKFDEAAFRFSHFKRVRFESCVLRDTDFSNAKLKDVEFVDCDFEATNFDAAVCKQVDLRGENLSQIKGVLGLKGATISSEQLMQLAPLMAVELSISVDEGN